MVAILVVRPLAPLCVLKKQVTGQAASGRAHPACNGQEKSSSLDQMGTNYSACGIILTVWEMTEETPVPL